MAELLCLCSRPLLTQLVREAQAPQGARRSGKSLTRWIFGPLVLRQSALSEAGIPALQLYSSYSPPCFCRLILATGTNDSPRDACAQRLQDYQRSKAAGQKVGNLWKAIRSQALSTISQISREWSDSVSNMMQ